MQNDEYYDAYMKEWDKMLKGQNELTEDERAQLRIELKQIELNKNEVSSNVS